MFWIFLEVQFDNKSSEFLLAEAPVEINPVFLRNLPYGKKQTSPESIGSFEFIEINHEIDTYQFNVRQGNPIFSRIKNHGMMVSKNQEETVMEKSRVVESDLPSGS
jgi:hypothetical protein